MPEAVKERTESGKNADAWHDSGFIYTWNIREINIQNALDGLYNQSVEMGVNALINLKMEVKEEPIPNYFPVKML